MILFASSGRMLIVQITVSFYLYPAPLQTKGGKMSIAGKPIMTTLFAVFMLSPGLAFGQQHKQPNITELLGQLILQQETIEKRKLLSILAVTSPASMAEISALKTILLAELNDASLYQAAANSLATTKDPHLAKEIVKILAAQQTYFIQQANEDKPLQGSQEALLRRFHAESAITALGNLQDKASIPLLKNYLQIDGFSYPASKALTKIGDKSTRPLLRRLLDKGVEIYYGGNDLAEALVLIADLQNERKEKSWPKLATQLLFIKTKAAKPHLVALFNHKKDYVRQQSATAFINMADLGDSETIFAMTDNPAWTVRNLAVRAMQKLNHPSFIDRMIEILLSDPHQAPRRTAAKVLGFRKIEQAVPFLEQALLDQDDSVQRHAFISLYILTGKKYPASHYLPRWDQLAKMQREHPTFY